MKTLVTSSLFLLVLLSHGIASADVYWSSFGAGCTPGDPALQSDGYTIVAGSVGDRSANTDVVTLYCPVLPNPSETNPTVIGLTYLDSSRISASSVEAQLILMNIATGNISNVNGAFVMSDTTPIVTIKNYREATFSHTLDFVQYRYYVRINLDRCDSGCSSVALTFYGVLLR